MRESHLLRASQVCDSYREARLLFLPDSLARIEVSPATAHLIIKDGVLYSKEDRRLICCPCAFTAPAYSVPEGTRSIGSGTFQWITVLQSPALPDSLTCLGAESFRKCGSLTALSLPDSPARIAAAAFANCSDAFTCLVRSAGFAARYIEENGFHSICIDADELPVG